MPEIRIDPAVQGRRAECYGATGAMLFAMQIPQGFRFVGTLTGEYYVEEGWPDLKWYKMVALSEKPGSLTEDAIWCDWGSLWLLDDGETPDG